MLVKRKLRIPQQVAQIERSNAVQSSREEVVITVYGGAFATSMDVIAQTEITVVRKGSAEWWCENEPPSFSDVVTKEMWINRVTCTTPRSLWGVVGFKEKDLLCPQHHMLRGDTFTVALHDRVLVLT